MADYREYGFPNAKIRVYRDRTCQHITNGRNPIETAQSRSYVAKALLALRSYRKTGKVPKGL